MMTYNIIFKYFTEHSSNKVSAAPKTLITFKVNSPTEEEGTEGGLLEYSLIWQSLRAGFGSIHRETDAVLGCCVAWKRLLLYILAIVKG